MSTRLVLWILILALPVPTARGASRYRPGDWVSFSLFRYVNSITTDHRHVYFATTGGITRYSLFEDAWETPLTTSDGLVDNRVNVVAMEPTFNDLWCATSGGVSRYNPATQSWTTYRSGSGLFLDGVHSIGVTSDARLLFETAAGTAVFDVHRQFWLTEQADVISANNPGRTRWYGARRQLSYQYPIFITEFDYLFDPPSHIQDREFRSYRLTDFLEDTFSNVWIGTWGLNVGKASLRTLKMEIEPIGLVTRNATAISSDGDNIWFGGGIDTQSLGRATQYIRGIERVQDRGGISRYHRKSDTWTHFQPYDTRGFTNGSITAIEIDSATVWFGTDEGVVRYDQKRNDWTTLPISGFSSTRITDFAIGDTLLWVGTESGVNTVNLRTRAIAPVLQPVLRDRRIYDMSIDEFGDLWIATDNGVYRHRPGGTWKKIEDPESSNLNRSVFAVNTDGNTIWFGNDSTILCFDRTTGGWKEWLIPLAAAGTPYRMVVSNRAIWLGTRYGAMEFDRMKESWQIYTTRDGLLNDTVQAILPDGDHIWFGTPEGVSRFYWNDPTRLNK
jgi:frataxin-like iron-binding protein CyaY